MTDKTTSDMSESIQESYWIPHLVEEFEDLKDNIPHDCYILVGDQKIATHRTVVQVNSSLLTSGDVDYDPETNMFSIEIDPEFQDADMISKITQSFYCGKIDVDEDEMKSVYKFAHVYSVRWLKKMLRPRFLKFIRKEKNPGRFVDIFSFPHVIWCRDLAEVSLKALDLPIVRKLIEDHALLDELSYECMKTLTMSDNLVDIPEYFIFELLECWLKIKSQKLHSLPADYENLAMNIRYHLIGKQFLVERLFCFSARIASEKVRSDLMLMIGRTMSESTDKDYCRFVTKETLPVKTKGGLETNIRSLVKSTSKDTDVLIKEINVILASPQLAETTEVDKESLTKFIVKKQMPKYLNLKGLFSFLNYHHEFKALLMVIDKSVIHGSNNKDNASFSYKLSRHVKWTTITESTIMFIIDKWHNEHDPRYHEFILTEISMLWCMANREKCENVVKKYLKNICFNEIPEGYKSMILLPTVKSLSPGIKQLECSHGGGCIGKRSSCFVTELDKRVYLKQSFTNENQKHRNTEVVYSSGSGLYALCQYLHPILIFNASTTAAEVPFYPVLSICQGNDYLDYVTAAVKGKAKLMIINRLYGTHRN